MKNPQELYLASAKLQLLWYYTFAHTIGLAAAASEKGKVRWFNKPKGFGSIIPEDGSEDVFVHFSAIQTGGLKTLAKDQLVEYNIDTGPKGPSAVNVVVTLH